MNTAIKINWYAMQKRAEEALKKAKDRRDRADFDVDLAEKALERVKQDRARAEEQTAAAALGVR